MGPDIKNLRTTALEVFAAHSQIESNFHMPAKNCYCSNIHHVAKNYHFIYIGYILVFNKKKVLKVVCITDYVPYFIQQRKTENCFLS